MENNIAVKAAGFKQRPSKKKMNNPSQKIINNPSLPQNNKTQKPQEEAPPPFSVMHNSGSGNAVQTFEIFILHLGNSASNKNTYIQ